MAVVRSASRSSGLALRPPRAPTSGFASLLLESPPASSTLRRSHRFGGSGRRDRALGPGRVAALVAALLAAFVVATLALPLAARAQPAAVAPAAAPSVTHEGEGIVPAIRRPVVLPPAMCEGTAVVEANMGPRRGFEPFSVAPDIHCGVAPRFMLGITHSARSLSQVDSGSGLCLRGEEAGCPRLYDGAALDALASLAEGDEAIAARLRLVAASFSPAKPSLRLGALVRLRRGPAALLFDPHLALGLANRDRGNRDQLSFPMRAQLQPGARVMVSALSGVRGELATFADAFAIPFGVGVEVSPLPKWDVGFEATFPRLLGPQNTFRQRHLAFYFTYRQSARGW